MSDEPAGNSSAAGAAARPLEPRPRLFMALLAVFVLWAVALIVLNRAG